MAESRFLRILVLVLSLRTYPKLAARNTPKSEESWGNFFHFFSSKIPQLMQMGFMNWQSSFLQFKKKSFF